MSWYVFHECIFELQSQVVHSWHMHGMIWVFSVNYPSVTGLLDAEVFWYVDVIHSPQAKPPLFREYNRTACLYWIARYPSVIYDYAVYTAIQHTGY